MLENRPDRDVGPLGPRTHRGRRAGLGDHLLGGRNDLATGFGRTPIASVGTTRLDHLYLIHECHCVAARQYRCFAHLRIPNRSNDDRWPMANPSPMEGV